MVGEKVLKMIFFPDQAKSRNVWVEVVNFAKTAETRGGGGGGGGGNFNIFSKLMVFGHADIYFFAGYQGGSNEYPQSMRAKVTKCMRL